MRDGGAKPALSLMRFLLALFVFTVTLAAAEPLRVGMELAYPPFEMRDPTGQPAGVSVDLAKALGEHLGRPVEIQNLPFAGLIPALKTGKIDAIISSMTATTERAQSIDFSEPYLRTGLALLVSLKSGINSAAELDQPNRALAVVKGTTAHIYASKNLKKARVLVFDQPAACALEVIQGKSDAFLIDQLTVLEHWQRRPAATKALLNPVQEESWAIGVRKGQDALRTQINEFLSKARSEGVFERLGDTWLAPQKAEFKKLGVAFVF